MRESKHPSLEDFARRMPPQPRKPDMDLMDEAYELLGGPLGGVEFGPNAKPPWKVPESTPRSPTKQD